MSEQRLHWRIAYSLSEFYYVIASSNVEKNSMVESWAAQDGGYSKKNGMASILTRSPNAKYEGLPPHVFVKDGDALQAMNKMIKLLDKINKKEHLEPIVKL